MNGPQAETGAGEDKTSRRWRITLTVVAWTFIVQAGTGALFGVISMLATGAFDPDAALRPYLTALPDLNLGALDHLLRQLVVVNKVQIVANVVMGVAGYGLLRRRKWGWYAMVILHLVEIVATFIWAMPMIQALLAILSPDMGDNFGLLVTILLALVPASIIAFFLARPIISQFEIPAKPAAARP
jgi:hypothetical protein